MFGDESVRRRNTEVRVSSRNNKFITGRRIEETCRDFEGRSSSLVFLDLAMPAVSSLSRSVL